MELVRDGLSFEEIRIQPHPEKGVDWVNAWTMHSYGKISVKWKRENGENQGFLPDSAGTYSAFGITGWERNHDCGKRIL